MEIKPDRMVHLGYAKYWRSDRITGLLPIEEDRGPGRRTEVFVASRSEPVVASRTEESILEDMVREEADAAEVREALRDLLAALRGISPVIKRMLRNEESFDVQAWIDRLADLQSENPLADGQEDLFSG
ncbi:MAG: hypothetical protein ACOC83_03185 [Gemmatimonadota bacterium]